MKARKWHYIHKCPSVCMLVSYQKYLHNIKTTSQVTSSLILQGGRTSVIFPLAQIFFFFSKKTKNLMTKPLVFLYFVQEACQLLAIWQISWFCLFQQFWWNISTSCFRLSVISLSYWPKFGKLWPLFLSFCLNVCFWFKHYQ